MISDEKQENRDAKVLKAGSGSENNLGKRLRELRKDHHYSQDYVASFLGVIRQTYSHYETGRCIPSAQSLYKLSGLYDISVEDLLHISISLDKDEYYDAPEKTPSSRSLEGYLDFIKIPANQKKYRFLSEREKELLYYYSMFDDADRNEIIEFSKIKAQKYI